MNVEEYIEFIDSAPSILDTDFAEAEKRLLAAFPEQTPPEPPATQKDAVGAFHAHLDVCAQCRNHPFNLCEEGAALLRKAAM